MHAKSRLTCSNFGHTTSKSGQKKRYELNPAGVICFSDLNPQAFLPTFGFDFFARLA
jgi:hypothetical protein